MTTKLKVDVDDLNLVDAINFFDKRNINVKFDEKQLFPKLVNSKQFDLIDFFIDRGTKPHEFVQYCDETDIDVINFLLDTYTDLSETDISDISDTDPSKNPGQILVDLILNDKFNSALTLIQNYKNNNLKKFINYNNGKSLLEAVNKGNILMIECLFNNGAKIKYCSNDPIVNALINNHTELIPILVEHGSVVESIMPKHLQTCINKSYNNSINYIMKLLQHGKLEYFNNMDLTGCLISSAKIGNIDVLKELVNYIEYIDEELYRDLLVSFSGRSLCYIGLLNNKRIKK